MFAYRLHFFWDHSGELQRYPTSNDSCRIWELNLASGHYSLGEEGGEGRVILCILQHMVLPFNDGCRIWRDSEIANLNEGLQDLGTTPQGILYRRLGLCVTSSIWFLLSSLTVQYPQLVPLQIISY